MTAPEVKGGIHARKVVVVEWPDLWFALRFTVRTDHWGDWELFEIVSLEKGKGGATVVGYWPKGSSSPHPSTPDLDTSGPSMTGFIKWDGCLEFDTSNNEASGRPHVCGRDGMAHLTTAMQRIYDVAKEHLPAWYGGSP